MDFYQSEISECSGEDRDEKKIRKQERKLMNVKEECKAKRRARERGEERERLEERER